MSTHSLLGVKRADGSITGCYVHFDGYPAHMIDALRQYFADGRSVETLERDISEAREGGGMRSFYSPDGLKRTTDIFLDSSPFGLDTQAWLREDAMSKNGVNYSYLVENSHTVIAKRQYGDDTYPDTRVYELTLREASRPMWLQQLTEETDW